jgi:hypothetical protein
MDPSLMDALLGGRGCAVDGTMSRNPLTGLAERALDSHLGMGAGAGGLLGGGSAMMDDSAGGFLMANDGTMAPSAAVAGAAAAGPMWMPQQQPLKGGAAPMGGMGMGGMGMGGMGMGGMGGMGMGMGGMAGGPGMFMMMQQQQQMMMMQQQQQHMQQQLRAAQQVKQQQKQQQLQAQQQHQPQADTSNLKQAAGTADTDETAAQDGWQEFSSKYGLTMALEEALDSGELTSERLDQIWRHFGAEVTANDPAYQKTSAGNWREVNTHTFSHNCFACTPTCQRSSLLVPSLSRRCRNGTASTRRKASTPTAPTTTWKAR